MTLTRPPSQACRNQSGNVMFLILIAVALFAFLSYVVAQSTRSNEGAGNEENTSLRASQIIQYGTYMEQAVLRMRFRDIPSEEICFDADGWGHNDYYFSACDDVNHQVFSTASGAGGVSWSYPPEGANDGSPWYIPANVCVAGVGVSLVDNCNSDSSSQSEDIVLILPNVSRAAPVIATSQAKPRIG